MVNSTWNSFPGSNIYSDTGNWNPSILPDDTAFFGASTVTSIRTVVGISIGEWLFTMGALQYNFAISQNTQFTGAGIITNGTIVSIDLSNFASIVFYENSTAGGTSITLEPATTI